MLFQSVQFRNLYLDISFNFLCCFFQHVLSVGEDGSYVEDFHWRRVKYIGGGSCGRCYFCEDAKTGFLFAIKKVRLSLTVTSINFLLLK